MRKPDRILVFIFCTLALLSCKSDNPDSFFEKKMDKTGIIGLQAAFVSNGKLMWNKSYGLQNLETKTAVNDSTLFMIASCSKPVTAFAVLKLHNDKKLHLDDDINDYLPFTIRNPHFPEKVITIRMLLSHVASFKDNWDILDPLYTIEKGGDSPIQLSSFIRDYFHPEGTYYSRQQNFFSEEPGKHWTYCNMGYALAGYIVEQAAGKTFSDFMRDDVFELLGMSNSYWFLAEIEHSNIATPHVLPDKKDKAGQVQLLPHYGYPDFPDGQLRTTVTDYAYFLEYLLTGKSISGEQLLSDSLRNGFWDIQFAEASKWQAIAWNYNEFDNRLYYALMPRLPSHTGGDPGVATVVSVNPEQKTAALVFVNSPPNTFWGGKIFYLDFIKHLLKNASEHQEN